YVEPDRHLVDEFSDRAEDRLVVTLRSGAAPPRQLFTVRAQGHGLDLGASEVDAHPNRHDENLTVPVNRPTKRPSLRVTETEYTPSVRPTSTGAPVAVNVSPSLPPAVRARWVSTTVIPRPDCEAAARSAFSARE